ncbi:unnamed protein product [Lasius platythorax]|uniref:Uncharacterized protein n=2 Tax=Lasius TaxID=488720 RepID=A0A0J7MY49_LASNI|nr:hypothetical protein RF55_16167 [Lasius niger]
MLKRNVLLCLIVMTLSFAFHSSRFFIRYVVKFPVSDNIQEETVAIVPSLWINYYLNTCKWPAKKYPSDKISRWVMSLTEPKDDFEDIPMEIMHEYDTYAKARKASIKAKEDSAIDTVAGEIDIEKCRRRRKPARYEESDSSGVDNPSPKKSKRRQNIPLL